MKIYPALDILDGRVVRLKKGDFDDVTTYGDPFAWLNAIDAAGIGDIHVVDLNGAKDENDCQDGLIGRLISLYPGRLQVGGGIRGEAQVSRLLDQGAKRVIFGTSALEKPELVAETIRKWGAERVVLALDVIKTESGYNVTKNGWTQSSGTTLKDALVYWTERGVRYVLSTDISRDGMMSGPNLQLYEFLKDHFPAVAIIASGGVSNHGDLLRLTSLGVHGAIVGKAFLSGAITLKEVAGGVSQTNYPLS